MRKVLAILSIGIVAFAGCTFTPSAGPQHIFSLPSAPAFLTEELAVSKARETLAQEGYNPGAWQPVPFADKLGLIPHKAPDGTTDEYFNRWNFNPWRGNAGRVTLKNGKRLRTYDVRLDGNRVICSEFHGI